MIRQLIALAWKEWREVRWTVGFALVTFIGLPLVAGIEGRRYTHHVVFHVSPWVIFFGGLLASVVAATAVCRDLDGRLSEFWRSRAVGTLRWLSVKYAVGLIIVLVCCIVPLVIEEWQNQRDVESAHAAATIVAWFPFIWTVQYGFGFASGALSRRTGPAIMLALALSLLAYCLPLILPPLGRFSIPELLDYSMARGAKHAEGVMHVPWVPWPVPFAPGKQMPFVIAAILLSAGLLALSLLAVGRGWHVRSTQKMTFASIAVAILLVLASATFQLATNLPILQTLDLGPSRRLLSVSSDGRHGVLLERLQQGRNPASSSSYVTAIRTLDLTGNGVRLGPEIPVPRWSGVNVRDFRAWVPAHPDYYFMVTLRDRADGSGLMELSVGAVNLRATSEPAITTVPLGAFGSHSSSTPLLVVGDKLYITWFEDGHAPQAVTIDVTEPTRPRIIPCQAFSPYYLMGKPPAPILVLEEVPAIDAQVIDMEKAAISLAGGGRAALCQANTLVTDGFESGGQFMVYQLKSFGPPSGPLAYRTQGLRPHPVFEFQKIGQYKPTLLEELLQGWVNKVASGRGSTVYVSEGAGDVATALPRITVFDISDPARPRVVGHFTAPERGPLSICPLPDGRALAAGQKLYLLGPPPGK